MDLRPREYIALILAPLNPGKGVRRLDPAAAAPKKRDWLYINMPLQPSFFINTKLVKPGEEPKSYEDLLAPKWKGKIVLQNPAVGGSGSGWFRATYRQLGLEYMRALAKQVVLVSRVNDVPDAVVRVTYAVGIAASPTRATQLVLESAPVKFLHPKEGSHIAFQGVLFLVRVPHPNAAKLFLQWFYSKEGQMIYSKANNSISVRKDVPQEYLPAGHRYVEGEPFLTAHVDDLNPTKSEAALHGSRGNLQTRELRS